MKIRTIDCDRVFAHFGTHDGKKSVYEPGTPGLQLWFWDEQRTVYDLSLYYHRVENPRWRKAGAARFSVVHTVTNMPRFRFSEGEETFFVRHPHPAWPNLFGAYEIPKGLPRDPPQKESRWRRR